MSLRILTGPTLMTASLAFAQGTDVDLDEWYPLTPEHDYANSSLIGLDDWVEPAGKHGRVEVRGDKLFYNGEEFKFWGTNTGYSDSKPSREDADRAAAFFARYGYNALRHHKHLDGPDWAGFQSERSFVEFEPEGFDRFDYYNKQLKDAGVFLLISPTFGVRFGRDDVDRIPYWEELGTFQEGRSNSRIRAPHGAVYLGKEIQDLQIEQTVKFLRHRNPYTDTTYAEDPYVFAVELFNEDSALFFGTNSVLQRSPTLRERHANEFSEFLLRRYGSEEAWREAWGDKAIVNDFATATGHLIGLVSPEECRGELPPERISAGTVAPWANPWFIDQAVTPGTEQAFLKRRMIDTALYLNELQKAFYGRFIEAIRETGFDGEIVTSNWQAGSTIGHLLNLHTDAQTGIVDRHNYFGGGRRALNSGEPFSSASLLADPGSGNLSAGFQQVDGACFMISEYTHVQPNEWYAEGPVLLGAYGWGLQGWDVSYNFAFSGDPLGHLSDKIGNNPWDIENPAIAATMPAVSRMVRRMDVAEAPQTHHLNVHLPSLEEGRMSFRGETVQQHDVKTFSTDKVPPEALAATRVAIDFTEDYKETKPFDLSPYLQDGYLVSSTGQLRWMDGPEGDTTSGYVLIDTPATKAFVGFAPGGRSFDLGDGFTIAPEAGFSVIVLTAAGQTETLASDREIVMIAMARARNTGMVFNEAGNRVLEKGTPPLRLEPVVAKLTVPFRGTIDVLNQDATAVKTSRSFAGDIAIDSGNDATPYYRLRK
ncbi:MAG: hypothetical protein ACFB21_04585 [Opitutales bacterium]